MLRRHAPQIDLIVRASRIVNPNITENELMGICMRVLRGCANPSRVVDVIRNGWHEEPCEDCLDEAEDRTGRSFCRKHPGGY